MNRFDKNLLKQSTPSPIYPPAPVTWEITRTFDEWHVENRAHPQFGASGKTVEVQVGFLQDNGKCCYRNITVSVNDLTPSLEKEILQKIFLDWRFGELHRA